MQTRIAKNHDHGIKIYLDAPNFGPGTITGYVHLTRRGGEYGFQSFPEDLIGADRYFEYLCERFKAEPGVVCSRCKGEGGYEYEETYGLSAADRWGHTDTCWGECPTCEGSGWVPEGRDFSPDYEPDFDDREDDREVDVPDCPF